MKQFDISIKISLAALLLLLAVPVWGGPVVLINSTEGNVFNIYQGKMNRLQADQMLEDFSEIITEEGAQVTFSDYSDNKFHLAGGGQVKILNKNIDLKTGHLWIQSFNEGSEHSVQTASSGISFKKGESILSFDNVSGKTQVLVITGQCKFSNLLDKNQYVVVGPGEFSFAERDYDKGLPRKATPIGYGSYQKIVALFPGVSPAENNNSLFPRMEEEKEKPVAVQVQRKIASVSAPGEGKVIFLRSQNLVKREPSSFNHTGFLQEKLKRTRAHRRAQKIKKYTKRSAVKINIFGQKKVRGKVPTRMPASIVPTKRIVKKSSSLIGPPKEAAGPFEDSLMGEYKKQRRHSTEVNQLIDELRNFSGDYQKKY